MSSKKPRARSNISPPQQWGSQCGFYAVINSFKAKYTKLTPQVIEKITIVCNSDEYIADAVHFGADGEEMAKRLFTPQGLVQLLPLRTAGFTSTALLASPGDRIKAAGV